MSLTPHGPNFSFVDSITILIPNQKLQAQKWLSSELIFFQDHFPGEPLMPGVLLVEAAAQAAGVLWGHPLKSRQHFKLAQVLEFRFLQSVFPNQTLFIEVELEKELGFLAQFKASLLVEDNLVARGKVVLSRNS